MIGLLAGGATCAEKWADDAHAGSKDHVTQLDETTASTELFGECLSMRRLQKPNNGLPVLCDKNGFKQFWGSRIGELPCILKDRMCDGVRVAVR